LNNFSRRPSKGQGGSRPSNNNQRFSRFKRRETPEDRLMKALGSDAGTVSGGTGTMPKVGRRPQPSRQRQVRKPARGQYIHPSKFVNKSVREKEQVVYEAQHLFADFPLNHRLQANIVSKGYVAPSAIQDQSIPAILEGRDVIGLANTGTGKTAAFLIPAIQKLMDTPAPISVLIITPTRELATQIDDEFRAFAKDLRLYSSVCVGGMNIGRQIHSLKRRPQVVIGTPGRLKDLINQRALDLRNVHTLVLDEADRMCDMGFLPDIKSIISYVPAERQNLFFSATMTITIAALISEMMRDPITVSVVKGETSDHVYQDIIEARDKNHRVDLLTDMLSNEEFEKVLVFGETKFGVQRLADALSKSGYPAEAIHGNKSQPQRQRALDKFKSNNVKVLVATDVAARGLDIPNVSHVINFDQPHTYDDYVHRIGRTGRGGATGIAYTFVDQMR
jgi:superfamily II DNA/RNA helicase